MFAKGNKWSTLLVVLTVVFALTGFAAAAPTPAGTKISNQATATYEADGKIRTSASNVVYVTVQQVAGVEVGPSSVESRTVVPGQVVQHTYTVKNTGNGPDTFTLEGELDGSVVDGSVQWYHDVNGNGVINSGDPLIDGDGIALAPGEEAQIIVKFTVPDNAGTDDEIKLQLKAKSTHDPDKSGQSKVVTYTVAETDVVTAVFERSKGEVGFGDTVTYTLKVTNQTTDPINTVTTTLRTPDETTLTPNSVVVGGIAQTVMVDTDGEFEVEITSLQPGQTTTVTYEITIDQGATAGPIRNRATVKAGSADAFDTNEVRTLVRLVPDVAISQEGDPGDYTIDPAKVGTEYEFTYTITNDGNGDDVIYVDTGLVDKDGNPVQWPVQLYQPDGKTPLPKEDGKYTVGELEPGESTNIVVKVLVPVDVEGGSGPYELETTVTSKADPGTKKNQTATFDNVEGADVTTTVDKDHPSPGKDVPNPGATVEYPVTIKNDGPTDDTFDLSADDFPEGTTVEFVDEDGNPITEVSLEPGEEIEIYVRITIPDDAEPNDEIEGDIVTKSQNNPNVKDEKTVTVKVAEYVNFTVAPDRIAAVNPGSFAVYEFTITNDGNSDKKFKFEIAGGNKLAYRILDEDNNIIAKEDEREIEKGKSATVKVRIDADYTTNVGWTESVQLVATTGDESRSATLTTTVIGSELSMTKTADVTEQEPGGEITYTIIVENVSTGPLTDVVIYDAVPQHTTFVGLTDGGVSVEYSTDGGSTWVHTADADRVTNVRWNAGELAVGDTVTVTLTVKIK